MRVAIAFLAFAPFTLLAADRPPNIVMIVGDDMGYADVGVHGCKDIPTPNIDAIANGGVRFTNGYVTGPYCSPTRASLLTGRYQNRFGHEFNAGGGTTGLPTSEVTLADRLKAAGYVTGMVGKWHLGSAAQFHPQKRGFDEFYGFLGGAHSYFANKGKGNSILRGTMPTEENEYLTDAFGREAVAFIDKQKAKPFFLYLTFNAVHTPMHATDARLKMFESIKDPIRRTYAAMMFAMDEAIGKVMDKLRAEKLEQDTLIFFISDNGGPTMKGTTVNASNNAPLRGSKRTTLEGGIRVPFFIKWKGFLPEKQTFDAPVIQLDLTATALAAAAVKAKPEWKLEGKNLLPFIMHKTDLAQPHDALYWRFGNQMAIRKGDWKLVKYDPVIDGGKGQPTGPHLYNLSKDIGEKEDLAAKMPDKVKELQAAWDEWNKENIAPRWGAGARKNK